MSGLRFMPAAFVLTAATAAAQVPAVSLACPDGPFGEPFTEVAGLVELPDGRVVVGDAAERRIVVLGPSLNGAREIGRVGSGPREFRSIGSLLGRAGGGAWVNDFVQRRLLPLTAGGTVEDAVGYPPVTGLIVQRGDGAGRVYGEARAAPGGSNRDSVFIVRWEPGTARVDTVARHDGGWSRRVVRGGAPLPAFPALDTWVALPAGRIAVLEAATYRVRLWAGGEEVGETAVPWTPVRVTQAERDAYEAVHGRGRRLGQPGAPMAGAPPREFVFPETLPPFSDDGVRASPAGRIWVERLGPAADTLRRYDVLSADGRLVGRVVMPVRGAVVGFGPDAVYATERNEGDEHFISHCSDPTGDPRH
jgi:hypothetical protein